MVSEAKGRFKLVPVSRTLTSAVLTPHDYESDGYQYFRIVLRVRVPPRRLTP